MAIPDAMESPARTTPSGVGPRLFITEMVMENFKSYAGEQRVGPFHKCFSAVVGPNGSGKSNVIDAMLFVFGKRARQMRLNKVSELIHNSTNHQNLDSARVSVHFQEILDLDDETYQAVPASDFTITRVAFRDNSSKYYINERASTFTEVGKKLRGKGVDLDNNRFLILQGEVEQISLMKPKAQNPHDEGFLEYLEDIIGSKVYVEKIEEAHKKLEELNEKRVSVVHRVKLSEKEKDGLQDAKDQAEAYLVKEAELVKWQRRAAELASEEAKAEFERFKERVAELEEIHKKEREKLQIHGKEMAEAEAHFNRQIKQRDEVEAELKACEEKFKTFERQDLKYREDLKHLKQKLKKLEEKLVKDAAKIEEVERETEESTVSIPKLEKEIVKLTQKLGEEENSLEEIRENSKVEVEKYRVELDTVRLELEPWEKQIIECQGKIGTGTSESKLLTEKHLNGRQAYERACNSIQAIKQALVDKEKELSNMRAAIERNSSLATTGREEEKILSKEEDILSAQEQGLRRRVNEIRTSLDSEKSQGVVLQAVLQAKESKVIPGIHGRLGDLGAIDAKFDVAISTACSGLDYIVVETTNAAQACVELLRSKGLGVGTFLILEKQKDLIPAMNQRVQTPQGVPRLFDLVRVQDDKLRVAFFYVLGHTVVAKDLDQGSRIAYGSDRQFARVVTLDGAMFEKSGTMSGGGGKPRGGRMGTKVRDSGMSMEALHNAETELSRVEKQLAVVRERIDVAVAQYQAAERTVGKLELEIAKTRMEVEAMTIQQKETSEQLGSLKKAAEPKQNETERLRDLNESVVREQAQLAGLQDNSKKLREKVKDLQEKLEFAGGGKVQQQKAEVEKLQKDIDKKSTAINKKKVQISTSSKTIKSLEKAIETTNVEKAKCLEEKEQKTAEFKEIESKAFALQEEVSKIQEAFRKKCEDVDVVKKAHKEAQKVINDLRTAEVDIVAKLSDTKRLANDKERKSKDLVRRDKELSTQLQKHVEQMRKEQVEEEMVTQAVEPPEACSLQRANQNVTLIEAQLKEMTPSLDAIAEYRLKAAQYDERVNELNAVTEERDEIKGQYDELRKRRLDDFMAGFNAISLKLKEMYQMITLGGDAELELVDSLDPFAEGVVFSVRPPKKSWKNIANLSGGEKTLSSLALVFALHHYKPTPLYVMDEIDAALDFKNVSIVGHYIKDRTKNAQFIIISLRNNMFELADRLIGIYKTDNCTKSITINPKSFAVPAAEI